MAASARLLRRPAALAAAAWVVGRYLRLARATGRWRIENRRAADALVAAGRPLIVCVWHGRLALMPDPGDLGAPVTALVSRHRDGVLLSRVLRGRGFGTVAGSTSRGGAGALLEVVRALRRGAVVAVAPDGPRGPRMRAAPGAVLAAKLSGAVILPVAGSASRRRVLGSWDRFVLPLPFARAVVRCGEPIEVPAAAGRPEIEALRRELEDRLTSLTRGLDAELGVATAEPGEGAAAGTAR